MVRTSGHLLLAFRVRAQIIYVYARNKRQISVSPSRCIREVVTGKLFLKYLPCSGQFLKGSCVVRSERARLLLRLKLYVKKVSFRQIYVLALYCIVIIALKSFFLEAVAIIQVESHPCHPIS